MTIKEFQKKYDIDYSTVYNATWLVRSKTQSLKFKEYDENELKSALIMITQNKIKRLEIDLAKAKEVMRKVMEVE